MRQIIVDTNGLLRFFLNDIPEQKKIVTLLLEQAKNKKLSIFVPQIVIFEIHFTLDKFYHFTKEEFITTIQPLFSTEYITIESQEIFLTALSLYKTLNISFVDCFLHAKAEIEEKELFTFDKKLKNL